MLQICPFVRICCSVFIFFLAISIAQADAVKIASLNTVLTDIGRNIGGDRVEITEIVKPGMDPHLYEPTPVDIKKICSARLVLASGLGFESYLNKLKSSVGNGPAFFVAGEMLEEKKTSDPHWWHSIRNVRAVANEVKNVLISMDPDGREIYEVNAKIFDAKLEALSKWTRLQIAKLPKATRILITSHDALGYFASDYQFKIHAVAGISTTDQPSSQKVRALIQSVKDEGGKAIFLESIENPKVLRQITKETGVKIGGTLYTDGLGTGNASTYDGMMRANVTTIVNALQ